MTLQRRQADLGLCFGQLGRQIDVGERECHRSILNASGRTRNRPPTLVDGRLVTARAAVPPTRGSDCGLDLIVGAAVDADVRQCADDATDERGDDEEPDLLE